MCGQCGKNEVEYEISMFDSVNIEVYGSSMKLRELANISCPEPRQIVISHPVASSASGCSGTTSPVLPAAILAAMRPAI